MQMQNRPESLRVQIEYDVLASLTCAAYCERNYPEAPFV